MWCIGCPTEGAPRAPHLGTLSTGERRAPVNSVHQLQLCLCGGFTWADVRPIDGGSIAMNLELPYDSDSDEALDNLFCLPLRNATVLSQKGLPSHIDSTGP